MSGKIKLKNIFICLGVLLIFISYILGGKDIHSEYIASDAGDVVELKAGQKLTQTWLPDKKEICGTHISFAERPEFDGTVILEVLNGETGEIIRSTQRNLSDVSDDSLEFRFETIKLPQATELEFNIKLEVLDGKLNDCIYLNANNNYNGLSIDGEIQNCGLGSQILYRKSNAAFSMLSIIGVIYILAFSLMLIFRRNFSEVIGAVILLIGILLYLSGLIVNVEIGIRICQGLAVLGGCYLLYCLLSGKAELKEMISWGSVAVLAFLVFVIVYNYNTILTESDEFSHWALAAKDMFYSNMLSSHAGTTVSFTRYPPFMALLQYVFLYFNGVFSVKFLFIAYQFSGFCLLITWLDGKKKRNGFQKTVIILITALFPLIFYSRYYNLIMIDAFLGIVFAYVLYCFFFDDLNIFNILRIAEGLIALVLTKEMGIVLAGIACLVFLICVIKEKKALREAVAIIGVGILALAAFGSWQLYCAMNASNLNETALISAMQMISDGNAMGNNGNALFAIKVLLNILLQMVENIKIGSFSVVVFLAVLLLIVYWVDSKKNKQLFFSRVLFLCIGICLYLMVLFYLYLTVFPEAEALSGASLDRYLFSYLEGVLYVTIGIFINLNIDKKIEYIVSGLLCIFTLQLASFENLLNLNQTIGKKQELIWGYDDIEENFHSFAKKSDRIYFWCDNATQMSYRIFRFSVSPIQTQSSGTGWSFMCYDSLAGKDTVLEKDRIETILSEFDYVYIANYEETAKDIYAELFVDIEDFCPGGIYRVDKSGQYLKLIKVGYSPIKRFY